MPTKLKQYQQFAGGTNKLVSQSHVRDNETPNSWNIEYTEDGLPSKRRGAQLVGSDGTGRIMGQASLYLANGTRVHLRLKATALEKYTTDWEAIAGKTFTDGLQTNFCQARNAIYIYNGTDTMGKYDGSTLSTPANAIIVRMGIYYNGMHVCSGNSTYPSRLYLSSSENAEDFTFLEGTASAGGAATLTDSTQSWVANAYQNLTVTIVGGTGTGQSRTIASNTDTQLTVSTSWTTNPDNTSKYFIGSGNTLDINKDDGQKIVALGKFEGALIVFKERSAYQVTFDGTGNPVVSMVNGCAGCVSHRSVEAVENDLFYLANDGVRTFGYVPNIPNVIRTNLLSSKLNPSVNNINRVYQENSSAIYHDNKYILAYPYGESTTCDRMVVFHLLYGAWSEWGDIYVNCFNQFITDNQEELYYGSDTTGETYKFLVDGLYRDGDSAINAYWYSKQYDLGFFSTKKLFKFADIQIRALTGTLLIDRIIDGSSASKTTPISSTFTAGDGLRIFMLREAMFREDAGSSSSVVATDDVRRIRIMKQGRTIQLKIYNSVIDESFTLMAIAIGYKLISVSSFDSSKTLY